MAVQLNNKPSAQDYMQMSQPVSSRSARSPQGGAADVRSRQNSQSTQSAQHTQSAPNAQDAQKASEKRAGDFEGVLNALRKTASELSEKGVKDAEGKAEAGTRDDSRADAAEVVQDLAALTGPLMKGMEQLRQLIESMQAELEAGDARGAIALAQEAAGKVSRFDPDLILGEDFVDGALGKKLQEFLVGEDGAEAPEAGGKPADGLAAGEMAAAEGDAASPAEPVVPWVKADPAEEAVADGTPEASADLADEFSEAAAPSAASAVSGADGAAAEQTEQTELAEEGPAVTPEAFAAVADEFAQATGRDARRDRGLERLAKLADGLLEAVAQRSPALAEQLKNLRDAARDGLTPEEADEAAAALEEALASFADAGPSENPVEGYGKVKENAFDLSKLISSDRGDRSAARSQRVAATVSSWEPDRDARGKDAPGDLASSVSASLNRAAADAFEVRPAGGPDFGRAGLTYTLNPEDAFGDGITKMLEFLRDEGISEAHIVVDPPALGRIDVSLQTTASGVEAVFKVDNEQLKQVLQQQLDSLKSSLQAQGIQVSSLAVDIRNRDDQRRQDAQDAGKKVRRLGIAGDVSGEDGEDDGARLVRLDLERGLLHWVA